MKQTYRSKSKFITLTIMAIIRCGCQIFRPSVDPRSAVGAAWMNYQLSQNDTTQDNVTQSESTQRRLHLLVVAKNDLK